MRVRVVHHGPRRVQPQSPDVDPSLPAEKLIQQVQTFADAVLEQIKHLISSGVPYGPELGKIEGIAKLCPREQQALIALALGRVKDNVLVECHSVDLAVQLLQSAECPSDKVEEVQQIVLEWTRNEVEHIRDLQDSLTSPRHYRVFSDAKLAKAIRQILLTQ